jgi:hypothetical protein
MVTNHHCCWCSWPLISMRGPFSIQELWIGFPICFTCKLLDDDWITLRSMANWKCYVQYKYTILIANFVSVMNSGCLMRLSNKCSFKYSAAREPSWPERTEMFQIGALRDNRKSRRKKYLTVKNSEETYLFIINFGWFYTIEIFHAWPSASTTWNSTVQTSISTANQSHKHMAYC